MLGGQFDDGALRLDAVAGWFQHEFGIVVPAVLLPRDSCARRFRQFLGEALDTFQECGCMRLRHDERRRGVDGGDQGCVPRIFDIGIDKRNLFRLETRDIELGERNRRRFDALQVRLISADQLGHRRRPCPLLDAVWPARIVRIQPHVLHRRRGDFLQAVPATARQGDQHQHPKVQQDGQDACRCTGRGLRFESQQARHWVPPVLADRGAEPMEAYYFRCNPLQFSGAGLVFRGQKPEWPMHVAAQQNPCDGHRAGVIAICIGVRRIGPMNARLSPAGLRVYRGA